MYIVSTVVRVSILVQVRNAPFDIGGWATKKLKKIVCRHKSQKKKFVENVGSKKNLLSKLIKNMLTRKNHQIVTYIKGKAFDQKILRRNIKKNCRTLIAKKDCFFSQVKKSLQATKTLVETNINVIRSPCLLCRSHIYSYGEVTYSPMSK